MNRLLKIVFAAALLAVAIPQAHANVIIMCSPDVAGGVQGSRTVGGTLSQVPSGTVYVLNGQGCGAILAQDTGWFASQGYTQSTSGGVLQFVVPVAATGTTDYIVGTLPASTYIVGVFVSDTDASHAVTGGINLGTTASGTDVVAAANLAVGTSSYNFVTDANIAKRVFSTTAQQAIHASAATSWNTPTTVTITIPYAYY